MTLSQREAIKKVVKILKSKNFEKIDISDVGGLTLSQAPSYHCFI